MNDNLHVRLLEEEEYILWNGFIEISPQGCVFDYSWWIDAVTEGDFRLLIITRDNNIVFGMPLPFYSTKVIQKPKLTQTLGILFAPFESEKLEKILDAQKKLTNIALEFLEDKIKTYRMYFHCNYDYWLPFRWKGFKQTTRYTYRINYRDFKSYDEIAANYYSNKKRNIKKGISLNIRIEESDDFKAFFEINKETFNRQGLEMPYTYEFFKRLDVAVNNNNRRIIFNAIYEDRVIARAYFVFDDNCVYYLASGVLVNYRDIRAQDFLIDHAIKYFFDKVNVFDFEGSMIENIERNFRSFGSYPTQYFEIRNDI